MDVTIQTTPETRAHRHSSHHREEILASELCGCFYCEAMFPPVISEWTDADQTAVCPRCGIDSVIGDKSISLTPDLLRRMNERYFGTAALMFCSLPFDGDRRAWLSQSLAPGLATLRVQWSSHHASTPLGAAWCGRTAEELTVREEDSGRVTSYPVDTLVLHTNLGAWWFEVPDEVPQQ